MNVIAEVSDLHESGCRRAASVTGCSGGHTVFLAFQLRSLDHSRFAGPAVATLSPTRMAEIAGALRLTLEL
jgi:mRNA-degrading endonuclease toxin of MazEF toxin-antitoxin module